MNRDKNNSIPLNININGSSEISNDSYDEFKEYIIKNNIVITNENKELRKKIEQLNSENNENENEIDKYDEKIRYMRGLLQNLYLLKEKSIQLKENWEKNSKKCCKAINRYSKLNNKNFVFNTNIYILVFLYFLNIIYTRSITNFLIFIVYQFISLTFIYYKQLYSSNNFFKYTLFKNNQILFIDLIDNFEILNDEQIILLNQSKEQMLSIDELEKGTVGVSQLIDNI